VVQPYEEIFDETYSAEVSYDKTKNLDSGTQYGRITVAPKYPSIVETVEYRVAKGEELEEDTNEFPWYEIGAGNGPTVANSDVVNVNGNQSTWYAEVQLDEKHVSNIQTRVNFVDASGLQNAVNSHAFDFEQIPGIRSASIYLDSDNEIKIDADTDNDGSQVKLEYRVNSSIDGDFAVTGNSPVSTPVTGHQVVEGNLIPVDLGPNDFADVRFTAQDSTSGDTGPSIIRRVYYRQYNGDTTVTMKTGGSITNSDTSPGYRIDENGFTVIHGTNNDKSYKFEDSNGNINGKIFMFDNGTDNELNIKSLDPTGLNPSGMQIESSEYIEIYANKDADNGLLIQNGGGIQLNANNDRAIYFGGTFDGEAVRVWDFFDGDGSGNEIGPSIDLPVMRSNVNPPTPPDGYCRIFVKEDGSGNALLYRINDAGGVERLDIA